MAAYALARIQYKPKFGNIMMFVVLTLLVIVATSYAGVPWWASTAVALALFFFLARAFGKHFTRTLGNGDILFWIISQRILPPIVVVIPVYMMFQAVGLLDTHLALIIVYAVANLPIVVWLMHDFFASLPIELEESAQLDGATRFGIFWDIVLPLTRPGLAATTLLTLILNWNEYLFAVFLATAKVQTMPIMVAAKNAGEKGMLWWEMCADHRGDDHSGDPDGDPPAALHCQGRAAWRGQRIERSQDGKRQDRRSGFFRQDTEILWRRARA